MNLLIQVITFTDVETHRPIEKTFELDNCVFHTWGDIRDPLGRLRSTIRKINGKRMKGAIRSRSIKAKIKGTGALGRGVQTATCSIRRWRKQTCFSVERSRLGLAPRYVGVSFVLFYWIKRVCRYDESTRPCKAISMQRDWRSHIGSHSVVHRQKQRPKNFRNYEKICITGNLQNFTDLFSYYKFILWI